MLKVIYPGDTPSTMKSLEKLHTRAADLQLQIRKLVLKPYQLDEAIADKLTTIATIAELRTQLRQLTERLQELGQLPSVAA